MWSAAFITKNIARLKIIILLLEIEGKCALHECHTRAWGRIQGT
jgi:hypothetical protein